MMFQDRDDSRTEGKRVSIPDLELIRRIGRGAYGEVWLSRTVTGTYRATKIVYRGEDDLRRAFEREYEGIQNYEPISLSHPSLMDLVRVGRNDREGFFYYEMELADDANGGRTPWAVTADERQVEDTPLDPDSYEPLTLRRLLRQGRLPVEVCARLGIELLSAVGTLHRKDRIHRDIKPSNIIFVGGQAKLTDVGLVALADATRSYVGTEGYAPPEGAGTVVADLFSLGKVLYEASTGKDRTEFPESPTVIETEEEEGWAELNEVVLKACAKEPSNRYVSAEDMGNDLHLVVAGRSVRRLRRVERVASRLKRVGVGAAVLLALASGIALYQREQTARFRELEIRNRQQVIQLNVANGIRGFEDDNLQSSLLWLTDALRVEAEGGGDEARHRLRLGMTWQQIPKLIGLGVHDGPINQATFSPDGAQILTASDDGTACLWELHGDEPIHRWEHGAPVKWAAFDPGGKRVVTAAADGVARVWDTRSGEALLPDLKHGSVVYHVAFSLDAERVVAAGDSGITIWDARTGDRLMGPFGHGERVNEISLSPNGRWFASSSADNTARVWDLKSGEAVSPPMVHGFLEDLTHNTDVQQATFSPDGTLIASASWDGRVRLWETASGKPVHAPWRLDEPMWFVCFSDDGQYLLGGGGEFRASGLARVWNVATGEPASPLLRFAGPVRRGAFSPDGLWIAVGDADGKTHVIDVASGVAIFPGIQSESAVWHATFGDGGHSVLSAGKDGVWRLWELASRAWVEPTFHMGYCPLSIDVCPRGTLVSIAGGDSAWLWDFEMSTRTDIIPANCGRGSRVGVFSPDGEYLAMNTRGGVALRDLINRTSTCLTGQSLPEPALGFSLDSTLLAVGNQDHTFQVFDVSTGDSVFHSQTHSERIRSVAFSANGSELAVGTGREEWPCKGQVWVYSLGTGLPKFEPMQLQGRINQLCFSRDGKWLAIACGDQFLRRFDLVLISTDTGEVELNNLRLDDGIARVAFSPDSSLIAAGSEAGQIRIWNVEDGTPQTPVLRHKRGPRNLVFSPDGELLLSASNDGTSRLWSSGTGELLAPLMKHARGVTDCDFSHDGEWAFTAGWDRRVKGWKLTSTASSVDELQRLAALYAGARVNPPNEIQWLEGEELAALWHDLRSRHPSEFTTDESEVRAWHRIRWTDNASLLNHGGARFHQQRLGIPRSQLRESVGLDP